jgi:hypothetical protein
MTVIGNWDKSKKRWPTRLSWASIDECSKQWRNQVITNECGNVDSCAHATMAMPWSIIGASGKACGNVRIRSEGLVRRAEAVFLCSRFFYIRGIRRGREWSTKMWYLAKQCIIFFMWTQNSLTFEDILFYRIHRAAGEDNVGYTVVSRDTTPLFQQHPAPCRHSTLHTLARDYFTKTIGRVSTKRNNKASTMFN